jgi:hypothetical protein
VVVDPGFLLVGSGCSCVLVDYSGEDSMASDRGVEGDHGGWIVVGRVLIETLRRSVVVEVVRVPVEDSAGVSLVVDQQSVGAFVADAANEPFGVAVCLRRPGRDLDDVDVFGGEDGVESLGELGVRSRIRKRSEEIRSPRSIRRFRAAWVVQAAVG